MIDLQTYKSTLLSSGKNLAEIRRNQSNNIINSTFTGDPTYKRVLILTDDGWKFEEAKYQKHSTPSILKDAVDYYLQFRPKVHYKIGTYVIVPDDTSPNINTPENPFDQPVSERTQWWMIVGRTDDNAFIRYSILKCNYEFKWIYDGKIQSVFGCNRNAMSYTSGTWVDNISKSLDNLTAAWLPDIPFTYKNFEALGLCDTRTITHEQRFFITNNIINPKVYQVTKVVELVPPGVIKLSIKQDEYNHTTDNLLLMVCDYYGSTGKPLEEISFESHIPKVINTVVIQRMKLTDDGELDYSHEVDNSLKISTLSYFKVDFNEKYTGKVIWNLNLISDGDEDYYVGLLKVTDFEDGVISIKPSKANSLIGKRFELSVSDELGTCQSSIELEVVAND